jgi:hypothetical protein
VLNANAEVAAYIGRWQPSTVSAEAAFARDVIAATGPAGRERAKNLLWAAGKLADYAIGLGLEAPGSRGGAFCLIPCKPCGSRCPASECLSQLAALIIWSTSSEKLTE